MTAREIITETVDNYTMHLILRYFRTSNFKLNILN